MHCREGNKIRTEARSVSSLASRIREAGVALCPFGERDPSKEFLPYCVCLVVTRLRHL